MPELVNSGAIVKQHALSGPLKHFVHGLISIYNLAVRKLEAIMFYIV